MKLVLLQFLGFAGLAALAAVLTIFSWAFTTGESPSDDGPRALAAEFTGYLIGWDLVLYSFTAISKHRRWELVGLAVVAAITGLVLSAYFANTSEVPETPTENASGFKNKMSDLHID